MSAKKKVFTALFFLLAASLPLFVLYSAFKFGKPREPYTATATEITVDARSYMEDPKLYDFYSIEKICGWDGDCIGRKWDQPIVPTLAWRVLAFTTLYKVTKDERFLGYVRDEVNKIEYMISQSHLESMVIGYGIWQLSEAYKELKDPKILKIIFKGADHLLFRAENQFDIDNPDGARVPMIAAVLARQLALVASLIEQNDYKQYLKENVASPSLFTMNAVENNVKPIKLSSFGSRLIQQAIHINERAEKGLGRLPSLITTDPVFKANTCWLMLTQLQLTESTGNQDWELKVQDSLRKASFHDRDAAEFDFKIFQEVAACVDVTSKLCSKYQAFCNEKERLIQGWIIPSWDSPKSPLCNGDGGFMSMVRLIDGDWCNGNVKAVSDNAYGIYLLSKEDRKYEVY